MYSRANNETKFIPISALKMENGFTLDARVMKIHKSFDLLRQIWDLLVYRLCLMLC